MSIFDLICATAFALAPFYVLWLVVADRSGHLWEYRNPATRTCAKCGRQEDWHCWAENAHKPQSHSVMYGDGGWWEEMRPGSGKKCSGRHPTNGTQSQSHSM